MSSRAVSVGSLTDREIAGCFNSTLGRRHRVRLVGGSIEPLYLPARGWAIIRYTRNYPASALHEIAHWCIAGESRRRRVDYGYWYVPPPRTASEQHAFAAVEEPVQALESLFSRECGLEFRVSLDDVHGCLNRAAGFALRVADRASRLEGAAVPVRAAEFLGTLRNFRLRGTGLIQPLERSLESHRV